MRFDSWTPPVMLELHSSRMSPVILDQRTDGHPGLLRLISTIPWQTHYNMAQKLHKEMLSGKPCMQSQTNITKMTKHIKTLKTLKSKNKYI